jgi:chromosome segregation ATPase
MALIEIHVHYPPDADTPDRLERIEKEMSLITDAIAHLTQVVNDAVTDENTQKATIADLNAKLTDANNRLADAQAKVDANDATTAANDAANAAAIESEIAVLEAALTQAANTPAEQTTIA